MPTPDFASGLDLKLTLLNQSQYVTAAQVVQANLAEAGINLNLDVLDGGAFWSQGEGEAGENLELSLQQFGGKADPSFQTQWFVSEPGRRMELAALEECRLRQAEHRSGIDHRRGEARRTLRPAAEAHG